jgi:hypothetical protein
LGFRIQFVPQSLFWPEAWAPTERRHPEIIDFSEPVEGVSPNRMNRIQNQKANFHPPSTVPFQMHTIDFSKVSVY